MTHRPVTNSQPVISLGLPVYNGETKLARTLDSILAQTFENFEVIISDNCSTDQTEAIGRHYASKDHRIRYVRQPRNILGRNFRFLLDQASAEYFGWWAVDDYRSPDFLALNYEFLSANPDYVASCCPDFFEGSTLPRITWELPEDTAVERMRSYLFRCGSCPGAFYGLYRREALARSSWQGESFLAFDWFIMVEAFLQGKLHRCSQGWQQLGVKGTSGDRKKLRAFTQRGLVDRFMPLSTFTNRAMTAFRQSLGLRQALTLTPGLLRLHWRLFQGFLFEMKRPWNRFWGRLDLRRRLGLRRP